MRARARAGRLALGATAALVLLATGAAAPRAVAVSAASGGTVIGRLVVAHQDGANPRDSRLVPIVDTAHGPVALRLTDGLPALPGTRVEIRHPRYAGGAVVGGDLARLGPPTEPSGDPALGPADFTPGPRKVLVLLATIGAQPPPGSVDAVRNIIFTAPNSANAFIQEESFGQLSLTGKLRSDGDVYGPYAVPLTDAASTCDNVIWGTDAEDDFQAATGMNPETWDNVIVVFQYPEAVCDFSGVGEIGVIGQLGAARHAWINAVLTNGVPTTSVVAHELGHNFGVDHAGGFECYAADGVTRISFSEACAADPNQIVNQYDDPFDVMGNVDVDGLHQENAYHKWESGWLPPSSVETVVRSGTYLIAPEESASSAVQLLEVPRGGAAPSYWLDFRQPFGTYFDSFSATDPAVNGVAIRYANSSLMPHPSKSWLIDTTPGTPTFADAPLTVGNTYTDASRGITISTLAVSPLGALVHITLADGDADDTTPPGPLSGLSVSYTGGALHLSWSAASDDSGIVQHYRVTRNGAPFADIYQTSLDDTAPLVGRVSRYVVTPIDPAGNAGPPSEIDVSVADTTAPSAPVGLVASGTGSRVALRWSPAIDDVGVASYEVDRDGQPIATGLQATGLTDTGVAPGTHTYAVRAFDGAGNVGAFATVSVVIVGPAAAAGPKVHVKTLTALRLVRLGKHRVLLSWTAQRGARHYQVLRAGKRPKLLATVKKVRYVDAHATTGTLTKSRYVVRAVLN